MSAMPIPIVGSAMAFPVRRNYCSGRNYAASARDGRDLQDGMKKKMP